MFFTDDVSGGFSIDTAPEDLCLMNPSGCGWSELWKCRMNGKFMVLKALKKEYRNSPVHANMLRKEFSLSYDLDHQSICKALDFRNVPDLGDCIVMQWVDGTALREMLPLRDRDLSMKIAMELCDAMDYIHSRQIVHRDLKPENIIITHNGHNVKLIDFGLSDADDYAVLKFPAGTRSYAAPEVIAGSEGDCRSDIWSLGMILSELDGIPRGIVRKCLARNPEKRYRSVLEVKRALSGSWRSLVRTAALVLAAAAVAGICVLVAEQIWSRSFPDREFRKVTLRILDTSGGNS